MLILVLSSVAASQAFVVPSQPLAQTVSAQVAKYRCLKSVCERARFTPLQAGVAFCPAENPGSEEPDGRAGPAAERLQKVFDLPSPSCATNRAVSGEDSIGLYDTNLEGQNDPEAMHLWSKLPDKIKSAYVYEGILGRGAYGIVILAHKKIEVGLPAQLDGNSCFKCSPFCLPICAQLVFSRLVSKMTKRNTHQVNKPAHCHQGSLSSSFGLCTALSHWR